MKTSIRAAFGIGARFTLRVFPLVILLALPAIALASGDGKTIGEQRWDLFWRIANFAILVGVLVYFARKPIANGIRNSIESVRAMLKEAQESRKDSEARMKEAQEKLAGVDKEISELMAAAHREGEAERKRIMVEAAQALEKLKGEAAIAIDLELKKAQDILRKEAADAAVALAEEIVSKNITPEDQARFVTEYLEKLEANQ